ncbi:site-specific DNA-methyltransferase [Leptospira perolatii]|uniref:Methyltransferase n=1 Tax=Leptospira perolatii TaxID=2023191 RepID=A0A2M9ZQ50_9LEPT|nr:site-specific DNA-methyltransferase [Leptospira perolatii]PJZ70929.1 site-specific DNA-methyltransferase [Leptospira perolatii]PJZ74053.1 site-specific DNA-methyltransferase [Leptospira perolatii]
MKSISSNTIDLVLTSPPYPMVQMWDSLFEGWNSNIQKLLSSSKGMEAFEKMHLELDRVWSESYRVLKDGGILLVNIGDATRSLGSEFRLYSNHSRILSSCLNLGFASLPDILWRKQTNSPTKFMGSGMLPVGAYVTYEHEYILVLRKGGLRKFSKLEQQIRRESAFFWEERNKWFSDVWEIKGERQGVSSDKTSRNRSAAFPLEFAYRLVNMFSIKGDLVLDPFWGTGTTSLAAMIAVRNSIGIEIDSSIFEIGKRRLIEGRKIASELLHKRWKEHSEFLSHQKKIGKSVGHRNQLYEIPVVTNQERQLRFESIDSIEMIDPTQCKTKYVAFAPSKNGKKLYS